MSGHSIRKLISDHILINDNSHLYIFLFTASIHAGRQKFVIFKVNLNVTLFESSMSDLGSQQFFSDIIFEQK